jgi:hypothetical protein
LPAATASSYTIRETMTATPAATAVGRNMSHTAVMLGAGMPKKTFTKSETGSMNAAAIVAKAVLPRVFGTISG